MAPNEPLMRQLAFSCLINERNLHHFDILGLREINFNEPPLYVVPVLSDEWLEETTVCDPMRMLREMGGFPNGHHMERQLPIRRWARVGRGTGG